MKGFTHVLALVVGGATAFSQTSFAQSLLVGHPKASTIVGGLLGLGMLYFNPKTSNQ